MQLKCGNIFVVFVNVFTLSESSVILKLSMVSECRREDSEVVQLTLSLNERQPIMTEAIIFTAASVMQQLWLADAGLAVRRGILGLCVFLQTVLFNLSFSHKLEPKCRLPQRSRAQWKVEGGRWLGSSWGGITSCSVTALPQKPDLVSWLVFRGSIFFNGEWEGKHLHSQSR